MDKPIRLIDLNVSIFDENNEKLSRFLKDCEPDIVCLQEVTRKVDDSAFDTFISKKTIDEATPMLPYSFYAPNWALHDFRHENFHGRKLFEHDFGGIIEYGNYVRSRFKISEGKSVFVQRHFSLITDWEWMEKHPGEEPRTAQVADLEFSKSKKLRIINYHGIWSKHKHDTDRTLSAGKKLMSLAKEVAYPTLISGDFNLFPDNESIQTLAKQFNSLVDHYQVSHTRPKTNELSSEKRNVVDYIFVSREIKIKKFEVVDSDVSDHLPLLLEFEL